MKKLIGLTFAVVLMASLSSMQASIIPCADNTLAALIALGSGTGNGCSVDDKIFNGFSYTPGAGAPVASLVEGQLDANTTTLTYGWLFSSLTNAFLGNFTLGFTVAVNPAVCATCTITSSEEQLFPGTAPAGAQAISVAVSAGPTPILINNLTFAGNTNGNVISPGVTTLTKTATSSGISSAQPLLDFESDVRQSQSFIPEPATLSLMGISLVVLGFIGRRRAQK
jgi:hypothetical protein